ncbi:RNA polymerase factor sigma-54 [Novosphingobium aerophilum]|uniref:RNA polymerase factor sigma-54 n=1 Tax=Novosphingobium TaxID=165696 RepID=UPI00104356E9|nr:MULTISPECIES: RNA polymerase factor sigma-54 [unclassified Novosphingobium]MPS70310.1 RNA polymerase factor sigma-54 [Novosphingobium sp.]TCM37339.1 RNA polymerase RpoN-/SigL-like sigma 54 subunit [Novosphingobium sp. ST904]WRT93700.1 RNA polymerase factor sigma-54 [Novosphingobium sp. RL4]
MALGPRLDLRQSQSLVMTPQLQQAIKLLALSNLEIEAFIGESLEANPLLDVGGEPPSPVAETVELPEDARRTTLEDSPVDRLIGEGRGDDDRPLDIDTAALDRDRDTGDWSNELRLGGGAELPGIDERGSGALSLIEHLEAQVGSATDDRHVAGIARYLIGLLDEAGYLPVTLAEVTGDLGISFAEAEAALGVVQSLDPTGVGARTLSECIALQAREADRHDPMMARLIDNLDLLARGELARLKRMCGVDDEDFADMLSELRGYDPKPGLRFGGEPSAAVTPDILVTPRADGGWDVAVNQDSLPRLIVNRSYYVELRSDCSDRNSRAWLSEKLADANWLIKALDQRQKTILKVASELVKQQAGFFRHGISQLKPLTLRTVAEAIGMHESTVSRVTSNKYLNCPRGTYEMKFFFTSGVAAASGEGASAEAVKAAIRQLIDAEDPKAILSDDTLVDLLKGKGFELARRTVAKYREAIGLGSSVQRRRQKAIAAVR